MRFITVGTSLISVVGSKHERLINIEISEEALISALGSDGTTDGNKAAMRENRIVIDRLVMDRVLEADSDSVRLTIADFMS